MNDRNQNKFYSEMLQMLKKLDNSIANVNVPIPTIVSDAIAVAAAVITTLDDDSTFRKIDMMHAIFIQVYKYGYKVGSESLQLHKGCNEG